MKTKPPTPKFLAARVRAVHRQAYLSAALWRLRLQEVADADWPPSAGEICTTERGVVLAKEGLVARASIAEMAACLVHEVMHVLFRHFERRGSRHPEAWNVAGDLAINPDVLREWNTGQASGNPFPYPLEMLAVPGRAPYEVHPQNATAEEHFDLLPVPVEGSGAGSQGKGKKKIIIIVGQGACGSCAGNRHDAEGLVEDEEGDLSPSETEIVRKVVAGEVQKHVRARGRGTVSGSLEAWAEEALTPSPVDWRVVLGAAVRAELQASGCWGHTYARPGRRQVPGIVLPALRAPRLRAAVISDTSGSRSDQDLTGDLADVKGILKAAGAETVDFIAADAEVKARGRLRSAGQARALLKGRGGTDMRVPIQAALENKRGKPDVIVVLTDGETPWPEVAPRGSRIVVVLPEGGPETPAWARRVEKPRDE